MANHGSDAGRKRDGWLRGGSGPVGVSSLGWLLVGALAFIIGTVVQLAPSRYPELSELLAQCERVPVACRNAVLAFDLRAHTASSLTYATVVGDLLRSLGAAVVISILITFTVELRSRREFQDVLADKTRELGLNVFHGMFNRDHPVELLNAVKEQILERPLVREHLDVTYTLTEIDGPGVGEITEKFIHVDVILSATTRNVSTLEGEAGKAEMPLALVLPNPQIASLKKHVRVQRFVVDGIDQDVEHLDKANVQLQRSLASDDENDAQADFGVRVLEAGKTTRLSAHYGMIKELEDTEVFRTLQICRSLSLTVVDKTNLDLHIQAKAIHPGGLECIGSGGSTTRWRIADIILPQQGIMVFWKRRRPHLGS